MSATDPDQPQNSLCEWFIALLGQLRLVSPELGMGVDNCQEDIEFVRFFLGSSASLFCHRPFALCLKRSSHLTHAPQPPATAGQGDGCLPQANGSERRGGNNLRLPVRHRPPPKTSLRLIQHPATLFFTSKSDFFLFSRDGWWQRWRLVCSESQR